jgi:hypothetical protein
MLDLKLALHSKPLRCVYYLFPLLPFVITSHVVRTLIRLNEGQMPSWKSSLARRVGQNCVYTRYMTVYLMNSLPKVLYNTEYIWFWPTLLTQCHAGMVNKRCCSTVSLLPCQLRRLSSTLPPHAFLVNFAASLCSLYNSTTS